MVAGLVLPSLTADSGAVTCLDDDTGFPKKGTHSVGVALSAPAVINPAGGLEDRARYFPTLVDLLLKALRRYDGRLHYALGDAPLPAPWVTGMFMLLRSSSYAALDGFDEGFFLYYEDVDLCARVWHARQNCVLCPTVHVIHDARRASRRNPQHMAWHEASMARYFRKHFRRPDQRLPLIP